MIYFWIVTAYLLFLVLVGFYRSRSVTTQDDFMVAGRKLGAGVLVGTLLATWIGSGSIIASAGLAYRKGLPALWFDAGVWAAIIILYLIAGRVRLFAMYTIPDILETRYNKFARILGTVTTIVAYTAIVSYQFKAGGMILEIVAGVPVNIGIIITAAAVIGYTVISGLISVAYTGVVNGIVMLVAVFVSLPFLLEHAGGWAQTIASLPKEHFQVLGSMSMTEALGYSLPTMLLLLGESNMYQRFFYAKDARTAKRSVIGWLFGTIIIETIIVLIAVVGSGIFPNINPEMVILHSARYGLPVIIGCLLLAGSVSIVISTGTSFLLVPSINIVRDIYQRFINPDASQKRILLFSRVTVILLGGFAFMQVRFFKTVLEMALYAYTMYGVGITPAVLAVFFWKRVTPAGGTASIASGMIMTLLWESLGKPFALPTVYPALFVSLFLLITVSLLTKKSPDEKWKPFFRKEEV
ncbi:sodium:solute symporter [candidate division KSB1 bacterium]